MNRIDSISIKRISVIYKLNPIWSGVDGMHMDPIRSNCISVCFHSFNIWNINWKSCVYNETIFLISSMCTICVHSTCSVRWIARPFWMQCYKVTTNSSILVLILISNISNERNSLGQYSPSKPTITVANTAHTHYCAM